MKRSVLMGLAALALVALALLFLGGPERGFTTNSAAAYKLFERGYSQMIAFQFAQADSSLRRAVALDERFAAAHALLSQLALRFGDEAGSEREAALADSLAARLPNALERAKLELLLLAYRKPGDQARDSLLDFILAEQPTDLMALSAKASVLYQTGRWDECQRVYEQILAIEPNHAPAYNMLGYLAAGRGDYEQAVTHLRKYAFLAPGLANPHDSLGEVLSWKGDYAEAEREFVAALDAQPDFHYSQINLGELYLEQGMIARGEEILESVRTALAGLPQERELDETLIRMYYTHELYDEALRAMESYQRKYPDAFLCDFYRAIQLAMQDRRGEANAVIAGFLAEARRSDAFAFKSYRDQIDNLEHQFRAMLATRDGDHEKAIDEWQLMLDSSLSRPAHERWWFLWRQGESYLAAGRPGPALENAKRILETNPARIRPLLLLARAALELGQAELAGQALAKVQPLLARADAKLPAQQTYRDLIAQLAPTPAD